MIIHNQMRKYPSFFEFSAVIRSQWVLPSFTSLIRISALNSKFTHYVTLATQEVSRLGELKSYLLYEEKVSRLPGLPYPTCRGETELSRPRDRNPKGSHTRWD